MKKYLMKKHLKEILGSGKDMSMGDSKNETRPSPSPSIANCAAVDIGALSLNESSPDYFAIMEVLKKFTTTYLDAQKNGKHKNFQFQSYLYNHF
jgi:hypothetical protein